MRHSVLGFLGRRIETTQLCGQRILLRIPRLADHDAWRRLRAQSRRFLEPWEPAWTEDELTKASFRQRIRRYEHDIAEGTSLPLFVFRRDTEALIGGLTIGHIRRGAAQSCMIGYWMGETHAGHGYMHDALDLVIPHVFGPMRLHRIEAACIPDNLRSIRLLEKAGFQQEGYLRRYLKINGAWRDHILYARLADERQDMLTLNSMAPSMNINA